MEQKKICPFLSTEDKKVHCLKEQCQLWYSEADESESSLSPANCAVTYLPQVVLEISNNTRMIKASMEETVAI
jgi:hypothetical protein